MLARRHHVFEARAAREADRVDQGELWEAHLAAEPEGLLDLVLVVAEDDEVPLGPRAGGDVGARVLHDLVEEGVDPVEVVGVGQTVDMELEP